MKERFRVTLEDTKTGEYTEYRSSSKAFGFNMVLVNGKPESVKIFLRNPKMKDGKRKTNGQ